MTSEEQWADVLGRAAEMDSRVMRDVLRFHRQWKKQGRPPAIWTLRWAPPAIDLLRESAGLDAFRRSSPDVWKLDPIKLSRKLGGTAALQAGVEIFLQKTAPATDSDSQLQELERLRWLHSSTKAHRWIDHQTQLVSSQRLDPAMTFDTMAFIARALDLLEGLLPGETIPTSVLGARVGAASKFFRPGSVGRRLLGDALLLDTAVKAADSQREWALEQAGVTLSGTAYGVLVAGPCFLGSSPLDFPAFLAKRDQAVYLTLQNLQTASIRLETDALMTVENETPFISLLKEGLHRDALIVLTAGFPNRAVASLLQQTSPFIRSWRHWGDTDLSGVRIARVLSERLDRQPIFFRSLPEDLRRLRRSLLPLSRADRQEIADDMARHPDALGIELLKTVLAEGGWLEQEAWIP